MKYILLLGFLAFAPLVNAEIVNNSHVISGRGIAGRGITGSQGGRSSTTSPANITGLVVWHSAKNETYSSATPTTPATNGGNVQYWGPKTLGLTQSTQAGLGTKPIYYSTAGPNGLPTLHFNADFMQIQQQVTASELTVFIVSNKLSAGAGDDIVLLLNFLYLQDRFTTAGDVWGVLSTVEVPTETTLNSVYKFRTIVKRSFNDIDMGTNGVKANYTSGELTATSGASFIGTAVAPIHANISELVIYNRALTAAEVLTVERYLSSEWSIPFDEGGI